MYIVYSLGPYQFSPFLMGINYPIFKSLSIQNLYVYVCTYVYEFGEYHVSIYIVS